MKNTCSLFVFYIYLLPFIQCKANTKGYLRSLSVTITRYFYPLFQPQVIIHKLLNIKCIHTVDDNVKTKGCAYEMTNETLTSHSCVWFCTGKIKVYGYAKMLQK